MLQEPNVAAVAGLIGEPTRATILSALLSGEALPASELAYRAHVTPQTASSHLQKLLDGDLITVNAVGRHRYYALKSREVAQLLEALALVAPPSAAKTARMSQISEKLCQARTCYDHLAGKLGVAVTDALLQQDYLVVSEDNYVLTAHGDEWFATWQIDVDGLRQKRRKFAYQCLDWSERHYHMAGALGAAIADLFFEKGWIKRLPHSRALAVTPLGKRMLTERLGIRAGDIYPTAHSSS